MVDSLVFQVVKTCIFRFTFQRVYFSGRAAFHQNASRRLRLVRSPRELVHCRKNLTNIYKPPNFGHSYLFSGGYCPTKIGKVRWHPKVNVRLEAPTAKVTVWQGWRSATIDLRQERVRETQPFQQMCRGELVKFNPMIIVNMFIILLSCSLLLNVIVKL